MTSLHLPCVFPTYHRLCVARRLWPQRSHVGATPTVAGREGYRNALTGDGTPGVLVR
jgi:hypothetical protein